MTKEIDIFIRVLQKPPATKGQAIVLYRYGDKVKELYFSTLGRTQNRSIILASIIAIEGLNTNCTINLHTQNNFGFSFMGKRIKKKWVNRDMGDLLVAAIAEGSHKVNHIDCSATDKGKDYQQALAVKLRGFRA